MVRTNFFIWFYGNCFWSRYVAHVRQWPVLVNLLGEAFALDSYSNFKFQRALQSTFLAFLRPTWSVHSRFNHKFQADHWQSYWCFFSLYVFRHYLGHRAEIVWHSKHMVNPSGAHLQWRRPLVKTKSIAIESKNNCNKYWKNIESEGVSSLKDSDLF